MYREIKAIYHKRQADLSRVYVYVYMFIYSLYARSPLLPGGRPPKSAKSNILPIPQKILKDAMIKGAVRAAEGG